MGFRFRKSIKIAPGVRVNLNKKSASISVGTKGARITKSTSGRTTTTVGIPGTGISYSKSHTSKRKTSSTVNKASADTLPTDNKRKERVKYPPRKPVAYTPPTEKPMASDAVPAKKERVKYPPRRPVAYTPPAEKTMASDAAPAKKERVKYPPRRPVAYTPPTEKPMTPDAAPAKKERVEYSPRNPEDHTPPSAKPVATESTLPTEPADAMMAAYEKNPKGYTLQIKIIKVLAPLLCIMATVLMFVSPIVSAIFYLFGVALSTIPRTFKEKQSDQPVTPPYKRKAVIVAVVFLILWLLLCISI